MSEKQSNPALERQDFGDVTVLRARVSMLRGDETTEVFFQEAFALVGEAGRSKLVLNLDGVVFLASVALGKLAVLTRTIRAAGGRLVLCKLARTLEEVLQTTHLTDLIPIYGEEQEAVQSFA
jgi:anti-anti-sigma factor